MEEQHAGYCHYRQEGQCYPLGHGGKPVIGAEKEKPRPRVLVLIVVKRPGEVFLDPKGPDGD